MTSAPKLMWAAKATSFSKVALDVVLSAMCGDSGRIHGESLETTPAILLPDDRFMSERVSGSVQTMRGMRGSKFGEAWTTSVGTCTGMRSLRR